MPSGIELLGGIGNWAWTASGPTRTMPTRSTPEVWVGLLTGTPAGVQVVESKVRNGVFGFDDEPSSFNFTHIVVGSRRTCASTKNGDGSGIDGSLVNTWMPKWS